MANDTVKTALFYACRASVAVPASATGPTQYAAFRPRDPYKVNGVIQTHGWNGDPLPTDPLPLDNYELGLLVVWDDMVPVNLSTAALGKDDYWVARPLVENLVLPDLPGEPIAIYRFYNVAGHLLYIGQTQQFSKRENHHKGIAKFWHDIDHSKTTLECVWGRQNALAREKHLIQTERPLRNVQHAVR